MKLKQPVFITDYPTLISPLAQKKHNNGQFAERGYLYISGQRICEVVSEQNDHIQQRERFLQQDELSLSGEFSHVHNDLIDALSLGCAPMGGVGLNINRLVSLVVNSRRVNDVTFFPFTTGLLPQ